jgi:alkylated DNA repair dioxygenase AlkB
MENLLPFDGELYLIKHYFPTSETDRLFALFKAKLSWQEEDIFIFGKWCKVPRLMCWYGDSGAHYRYSGVDHQPLPWTSELLALKKQIEQLCGHQFNSVLANLYRDGKDSMGCHADDEPELGFNPVIASVSFGASRLLKLHHKKRKAKLDIELEHGDLLIMAGAMQHHWLHALPKTRQLKTARINLTFRRVFKARNEYQCLN